MAAKKKKKQGPKLSEEQRDYVKHMRKQGYLVYFSKAGEMMAVPRQVGAKRGHKSCHR